MAQPPPYPLNPANIFLTRVAEDAMRSGYLQEPVLWQGREVRSSILQDHHLLAANILLFPLSPLITFYAVCRALSIAGQAEHDLKYMDEEGGRTDNQHARTILSKMRSRFNFMAASHSFVGLGVTLLAVTILLYALPYAYDFEYFEYALCGGFMIFTGLSLYGVNIAQNGPGLAQDGLNNLVLELN